jgi:glycosyltransferase involved in cell wall biosynthesis
MYPGPSDPDYGVFVERLARALEEDGHVVRYAVADRRSGSVGKQLGLAGRSLAALRGFRPDVVYAHYLVPAGAIAAGASLVARAPLVVTAHGRDVRNARVRGVAEATRLVVRRASTVVCVSNYLRRELLATIPAAAGKVEVISSGVDLERFAPRDAADARTRLGWDGDDPFFLAIGTLDERKNVVRLADAFARLGRGSFAFVGDGPLRSALEGRERVRVVGRIPHAEVADWVAAADVVCLPSLVEPLGQALLEAMAGERSVVATEVGGPPEFVTPAAGVLVDPLSVDSIADGLRRASELPRPNPAARVAAAEHDVRRQARRVADVLARAAFGPAAQ